MGSGPRFYSTDMDERVQFNRRAVVLTLDQLASMQEFGGNLVAMLRRILLVMHPLQELLQRLIVDEEEEEAQANAK